MSAGAGDRIEAAVVSGVGGWRFPVFALSGLASFALLVGAILVAPSRGDASASFADAFRAWCFGVDPATGTVRWSGAIVMLTQPLLLASIVLAIWSAPLREARSLPLRRTGPVVGAALLSVLAAGAGMVLLERTGDAAERPFDPADLRTALPAPRIELTSHDGAPVSLADERGRVVLLTAVYASCGQACPMIMAQVKRAVESVAPEDRADLRVVCVTLAPEYDTPDVLAALARLQGVAAPLYRLCTGDPAVVNRALDDMGVARKRDPATGIIDHANIFLVIDRKGKLAYRFGLGEQQERWLSSSLTDLLRERPAAR